MKIHFITNDKIVRLLSIIMVIANLFTHSPEVMADEWDEAYENGKVSLDRGVWRQSISSFQAALNLRPNPDNVATTTGLKLVEYLPFYYLGQAYLFSGDYEAALANFQNSLNSGAIQKTVHQRRLEKWIEMAEKLILFSKQSIPDEKSNIEFENQLLEIQNLIISDNFDQAQITFAALKRSHPDDKRITIIENWIQKEQQNQTTKTAQQSKEVNLYENRFREGLDYYLLGQYDLAIEAFNEAKRNDPEFNAVTSWIRRTQTEIERLKLVEVQFKKEDSVTPEVIEKIITQTTAPVFALSSPTSTISEIRSRNLILSGMAGDDNGIDFINLTINGKPLLDASGKKINIQPQKEDDATRFSFSTRVPLQMGENQVVLTAFDVDSLPHRTIEQLTVIRNRPIYQTMTFGVAVGAIFLLGIGGLLIFKIVKYRIAIVNKYNPYIAGSPIRNEEMFFGREKLIKRILNTLHNNSLMIHGQRRIGKTSMQHQIKFRLENLQDPEFHFIPVMIDLQGTSEERFFSTLMEEILDICKNQVNGEVSLILKEKKADYSGRDFSKDLKVLLQLLNKKTAKKLKLVLLMDEVDELNKYSEQVNQKLRSVFMKTFAENLVAVMSGAYIRKSWESEGSPWYNFFEEIELPPFETEDAIELICKPVAGIFKYEDAAVDKIIENSECKPYIIQRICINAIHRIIEDKRRKVTVADVEAVSFEVLEAGE